MLSPSTPKEGVVKFDRLRGEVVHVGGFNPRAASAKVIGKVVVYVFSESAHVGIWVAICVAEGLESFDRGLVE